MIELALKRMLSSLRTNKLSLKSILSPVFKKWREIRRFPKFFRIKCLVDGGKLLHLLPKLLTFKSKFTPYIGHVAVDARLPVA